MQRSKSRILPLILFFVVYTTSLLAQTVNIKFIETTDEHGAIFPYNFTNGKETNHSLAQFYTYVKEERAEKNQDVILLSGGDWLQGTPVVYYYNFEKPDVTHIFPEVMNYIGYDAAAVGNHDIETGHPVYDKVYEELNFPWLSANAVYSKTGEQYFPPYKIIEKEGVKIAVLGMITPAIPQWLPQNIYSGIEFKDMIETARKWVKIIKENEKPDFLIGLFHSGVEYTYGGSTAETYKNENASKLVAQQVPGFDIIFVGHDHHGWNFFTKNSKGYPVLIMGGTSVARDAAVANVKFTFNKDIDKWESTITGQTVELKNYSSDKDFMNKFKYAFDEVKDYVSKPLGVFTKTITTRESIFGPSAFVDLINSIQLELTGADISFTAPLSFNATIEKGKITVGNMFNLYRYENLLYTMELTGKEIKDYLEYAAALWFNQMENENDHLLKFSLDENGRIKYSERTSSPMLSANYYNFDCAAGIDYTVDVSKPAGERINIISMSNGEKFNWDKKYTVAVNSYRGNGGGGHLTRGAGILKDKLSDRVLTSTQKDLRYYMMKWIEKKGTVDPQLLNNWKVIPQNRWEKGKEKDYKILYR
jgi:2',3'-cyclic-nucleotide 2'-phosphodiesterase/3'-nucleotidase